MTKFGLTLPYKLPKKEEECLFYHHKAAWLDNSPVWLIWADDKRSVNKWRRNDCTVPLYHYIGDRIPQILHCRLRLSMSDLNCDLFERHLSDNLPCACTSPLENANHYLLNCPLYENFRKITIGILPPIAQNCQTLLCGNDFFSYAFNSYIFLTVQDFISSSGRFDM